MDEVGTSSKSGGDEDAIENRIRNSFSKLGYSQLNAVKCTARGDQLLLTGELDSFYLKQVAQSVAIKVPGVRNVQNDIRVN